MCPPDRADAAAASTVRRYELLVDGAWVPARSGATFASPNPYTGEAWATVPDAGAADVELAVAAARGALEGEWGRVDGFGRAALMRRLAEIIARDAEDLARCESRDNGKLLREMRGQLEYLPTWLTYFAGYADKLEGRTIPSDRPNYFAYTRHEPAGVIAAITPWNSPIMLLMWKLAPALAAGCTMVAKPSESTPVSTLEFAARVQEAGFPAGVFNVLTGDGPELGKALVSHPGIDKVAFTGSPEVGAKVAAQAAARLTPALLELGGKSAQIVFADADLDAAANGIVAGIYAAAGQTCIAGSRLLVESAVAAALVEKVAARARAIRLGDPLLAETELGPVANRRQFERVLGFVDRAVEAGAEVVAGGRASAELGGLFIEPTVLRGIRPDDEIAQQEVFGPVLAVLEFADEDEAVALANGTNYALGAGVWTRAVDRAHRVAARVDAGTVWVNCYRVLAPNVPFGGSKDSGWGRENGGEAIEEFTKTKAVWVEIGGEPVRDPFRVG